MSHKAATNFVLVVLVMTLLAGCNLEESASSTQADVAELAWAQEGNVYSYEASYPNPNGTSEDTFTVTLDENGVVTSAGAIVPEDGGKHAEGLVRFNDALSQEIVGKNLSDLGEFDTLGQYSLTTDAFNDAIKELQSQVEATT